MQYRVRAHRRVGRVVSDPLQLPLEHDLGEVRGEAAVLQRRGGRQPQPLHRAHHVPHQGVPHRVVHLAGNNAVSRPLKMDNWTMTNPLSVASNTLARDVMESSAKPSATGHTKKVKTETGET